jgi:hypothetical protein
VEQHRRVHVLSEADINEEFEMLYTVAVVLLVLWLLGFFALHVGGGLIHLLLVIAIIIVVFQLISGRRAV